MVILWKRARIARNQWEVVRLNGPKKAQGRMAVIRLWRKHLWVHAERTLVPGEIRAVEGNRHTLARELRQI